MREGTKARCWVAVALLLCACGTRPTPAPARRAHEGLHATLWIQTSAEYRANSLQAFRSASAHLDLALAEPTWTAALEQQGDFAALPPAIILDMDEAILRSDRFQAWLVAEDADFDLEAWNAWVRSETSQAMPGALEYVRHAQEHGVEIFYVTNRTAAVEQATFETLGKLGFPVAGGLDSLLTQDERPDWPSDKSSRRAHLAGSHRILQIVGDNLNDFVSGTRTDPAARRRIADAHAGYWGTRWIIMPNPAYGGWSGALIDFDYGLSRDEQLRRKYEQLTPWR